MVLLACGFIDCSEEGTGVFRLCLVDTRQHLIFLLSGQLGCGFYLTAVLGKLTKLLLYRARHRCCSQSVSVFLCKRSGFGCLALLNEAVERALGLLNVQHPVIRFIKGSPAFNGLEQTTDEGCLACLERRLGNVSAHFGVQYRVSQLHNT